MSNGNYSTAVIVTCRECGSAVRITMGLCQRHYKIENRQKNLERINKREKEYRDNNKERLSQYFKEYRQKNSLSIKVKTKARNKVNAAVIKEKNTERYQKNKQFYSIQKEKYRAENKERLAECNRAYYANIRSSGDPKLKEQSRLGAAKRRARKLEAKGSHTMDDIKLLLRLQKGLCVICRANILRGYHIDHIEPLSKGGSNGPGNLQLLCVGCNLRKSSRDPITHMQSLGFLL